VCVNKKPEVKAGRTGSAGSVAGPSPGDLRMFRVFQHLSDEKLEKLARCGQEEELAKGLTLFAEGDPGQDLFVVVAGAVEGTRRSPLGPLPLLCARIGHLVGEEGFLDLKQRPLTAVPTMASVLLRFDAPELRKALIADQVLAVGFYRALWYSLVAKLRHANELMTEVFSPGRQVKAVGERQPGENVDINPTAKVGLFSERGLGAAELRLLATTLTATRYPADANIFLEGDRGNCLYLVVEGKVRISRQMPGMGEEALAILGHGELFGEASLVDDQPRSADARAHDGGCTVLALTLADIDEVLGMGTGTGVQFVQLLCHVLAARLRTMYENLVSWRVMAGFR
jgi:CRP/FNR family transcriptional regulator, cyclic AMP receptor protein